MTESLTNEDELVEEAEKTTSGEHEVAADVSDSGEAGSGGGGENEKPEGDGSAGGGDAPPRAREESREPDGKTAGRPQDVGQTELIALRGEFEDLNDRHLRLVAEFNNFRRRSEQERLSAWARAQADLVSDLLDVLDDIQRVAELDLSNATVEAIMEGIDLVERKFRGQLKEAGVEVLEPTGEPFDPERMEAMMRVPAEEDDQVDTVAQVFQKGYSLKGILVRPARVSVYTAG